MGGCGGKVMPAFVPITPSSASKESSTISQPVSAINACELHFNFDDVSILWCAMTIIILIMLPASVRLFFFYPSTTELILSIVCANRWSISFQHLIRPQSRCCPLPH